MRKAFTFDDVALVPQYNNIASRTEPDLSSWITKNTKIGIPIIPSNMDTVISFDLAEVMKQYEVPPIVHRFMSFEDKMKWIRKYPGILYMSCGVKDEHLEELIRLHIEFCTVGSFRGVCFDVAHGHSQVMIDIIKRFKDKNPDKDVIAGNVCTAMAYHDLVVAGADAIKVGIGPGAACTTRVVTGFGVPQFTAIQDCAQVAEKLRVPLIADGGIRNSRDIVLALAAGASSVMVGKLFALTKESAAEKRVFRTCDPLIAAEAKGHMTDEEQIACGFAEMRAKYRGQASEDFQNEFYGGLKEKTVAEGDSFWGIVNTPASNLIDELLGGIRSGMTYGGARNIKELQRKAEFVEVNPATYITESNPRKN